jgi:hypothetical protein
MCEENLIDYALKYHILDSYREIKIPMQLTKQLQKKRKKCVEKHELLEEEKHEKEKNEDSIGLSEKKEELKEEIGCSEKKELTSTEELEKDDACGQLENDIYVGFLKECSKMREKIRKKRNYTTIEEMGTNLPKSIQIKPQKRKKTKN